MKRFLCGLSFVMAIVSPILLSAAVFAREDENAPSVLDTVTIGRQFQGHYRDPGDSGPATMG